jgi:hypothetical protein
MGSLIKSSLVCLWLQGSHRPSVAVTQAGVFANLWNKIGKILKIFERLDYLRSQWVLCQL